MVDSQKDPSPEAAAKLLCNIRFGRIDRAIIETHVHNAPVMQHMMPLRALNLALASHIAELATVREEHEFSVFRREEKRRRKWLWARAKGPLAREWSEWWVGRAGEVRGLSGRS